MLQKTSAKSSPIASSKASSSQDFPTSSFRGARSVAPRRFAVTLAPISHVATSMRHLFRVLRVPIEAEDGNLAPRELVVIADYGSPGRRDGRPATRAETNTNVMQLVVGVEIFSWTC